MLGHLESVGLFKGGAKSSYSMDKQAQLKDSTQARLIAGHGDIYEVEEKMGKVSPAIMLQARLAPIKTPKPRQKHSSSSDTWGVVADKVYVPPFGPNKNPTTGEKTFLLFGLDEDKMRYFIQDRRKSKFLENAKYHMLDPANNCSGKTLELLKAGGAELFGTLDDTWVISDPNTAHQSSIRLQQRVDRLNETAERLEQMSSTEKSVSTETLVTDLEGDFEAEHDIESGEISTSSIPNAIDYLETVVLPIASGALRTQLYSAIEALKGIEKNKATIEGMMPHCINFVEATADIFKGEERPASLMVLPQMMKNIKGYYVQAYEAEVKAVRKSKL